MGLGHIDNGTTHAADEDHAAGGLALHQVLGDGDSEEVGAVDVDAPQLAQAVDGVVDGIVVLGEASTGDQVVDLTVLRDDAVDAGLDTIRVRNVSVVSRDLGDTGGAGVLLAEDLDELGSLLLGLLL